MSKTLAVTCLSKLSYMNYPIWSKRTSVYELPDSVVVNAIYCVLPWTTVSGI